MKPSDLPPSLRRGPFTRQHALGAGMNDLELASNAVRRLYVGVYVAADYPMTHGEMCDAVLLRAPIEAAITGIAALKLWNLMIPAGLSDMSTIDVALPQSIPWRGDKGIRVLRPVKPAAQINRIVIPADVWRLLAGNCTWIQLVELGDQLVRRTHPLTTVAALEAALVGAEHCRGYAKLTRALRWIRPGVDSIPETDLRLMIIAAGLPEPVVNQRVELPDGVLYPDLSYPQLKIAIEYDGAATHRADDLARQRDNQRIRRFRSHGWDVVVSTATDLADPRRFIADLRRTLGSQGFAGKCIAPFRIPRPRRPDLPAKIDVYPEA